MKPDLGVAVAAIGAVIAISLLTARAPQPPPYATHASDDYAFGGYRAWYDLLAREGLKPQRFHAHHDALPESGIDTLIVAFPDDGAPVLWNAAERSALRAWIRGGGRLIDVGITPPTRRNDANDEPIAGVPVNATSGPLRGPWSAAVVSLASRDPFRIVARKHHRIETLLADRAGLVAVRYREGRGDVVSVTARAAFENRRLAAGDAARLAYLVAQPRHPGGIVAFDEAVRGAVDARAWYRALTVPQLLALGIAALAGVFWLLYGFFPLGPPVRARAPREPTSAEFVDAVAALYGRARAREHARDALVGDARRNLDRAPRTAESRALGERVARAARSAVPDDATLVAVAALARTTREETIRAGRNASDDSGRTVARGALARRRRR